MNRTEKSAVIESLRDALADVPSIVVVNYHGLTVSEVEVLRNEMRKAGVTYQVVKNSLVKQAVHETSKAGMAALMKGNTAIAYHAEDPTAAAKVLRTYMRDNEKLTVCGGWIEGEVIDAKGVDRLADMPGKDELRARFLSVLQGVPTKFVRTLVAGPTQFVQVLQAYQNKLAA